MSITGFSFALLIASSFTGFVTEAVKGVQDEHGYTYASNTLAGAVAVVAGLIVGAVYLSASGAGIGLQAIVTEIAMVLLTWLCAMVGYDKAVQTITQIGGDNQ